MANLERGLYLIPDSTLGMITRYEYDRLSNVLSADQTTADAVQTVAAFKDHTSVFNIFVKDVESLLHPSITSLASHRTVFTKWKNSTEEPENQLIMRHTIYDLDNTTTVILMTYTDTDATITCNSAKAYRINWSDYKYYIEKTNEFVDQVSKF